MSRQSIMTLIIAGIATLLTVGIVVASVVLVGHRGPRVPSTPTAAAMPTPTPTPTIESTGSPPSTAPVSISKSTCPRSTVTVSTAKELTAALSAAHAGTVIEMAPGVYPGQFVAKTSGTSSSPIWLCGSADSKIDGGKTASGYAFHLESAAYWHLLGFTVTGAQKGVVADASDNNIIEGLNVTGVGDEGIHLRSASSNNVVTRNTVSNTGLLTAKYGEGIYVGSARKNWCTYSNCQPDHSDGNVVAGNTVSNTTAENIDIKEGTTGGIITQNSFNGVGMVQSAADSWIDVKGNDWTIDFNHGMNSVNDGFQSHQILPGWGTGNHFSNNVLAVNGPGYGINLTPVLGNVVSCSNVVTGAARGTSNTHCTTG